VASSAKSLDEALHIVETANRTCNLVIGVGDGANAKVDPARIFRFSPSCDVGFRKRHFPQKRFNLCLFVLLFAQVNGIEYSGYVAIPYNDTTLIPVNDTWHSQIEVILFF
jgi:hypothetical protein